VSISGVMHLFKDKELKFHYFCLVCVKNGNMNNKYIVDIMWAIKRPIKDLESKPWPEYDSASFLEEESRGTVQYISRYKINGKDQELYSSLEEIEEASLNDLNPMIYLRVSRAMKPDSVMDAIQISNFYE
jgi:hypothetical protein